MVCKSVEKFSKYLKKDKIKWLIDQYFSQNDAVLDILETYQLSDEALQKVFDNFVENPISNFILPYAIAPNFLINNKTYAVPMVTEESSVVASVAKTAKFWLHRGGFKATVIGTEKTGQIHFKFNGNPSEIAAFFESVKPKMLNVVAHITANMKARGGGVVDIELINKTAFLEHYYQLHCRFETLDAMGANFINSCLEEMAQTFQTLALEYKPFIVTKKRIDVIMSILSNYTPNCCVRAEVSCPISNLSNNEGMPPEIFAQKFLEAIQIAKISKERAVTHNKGIMNGIDAVVIATGNDFRAIEACVHAYACKGGSYKSLSDSSLKNDMFKFWIDIPLALGTIGGVTRLHPLATFSMALLGKPTAKKLMEIIASVGLAQNFAAVRSLVTTGIQKGHMKMHLNNILTQLKASKKEQQAISKILANETISFQKIEKLLLSIRK